MDSIKIEKFTLALALAYNDVAERLVCELSVKHFSDVNHIAIFTAIKKSMEKWGHADISSIDMYLTTDVQRDKAMEIIELPFGMNFDNYKKILIEAMKARCSADLLKRAIADNDCSYLEIAEKLYKLNDDSEDQFPRFTMTDLANRACDRWMRGEDTRKTYHFGIPVLDDRLKIRSGNMVYIVAPAKTGKTWLESIISQFLAIGEKVCFFSLEMHPDDIYTRISSHICERDISQLDYMVHKPQDLIEVYSKNVNMINERKLAFYKARGMTLPQLKNKIKMEISRGAEIIIIDFIQRIVSNVADPRLAITQASRELTDMAGMSEKLFIVASQTGRAARSAEYTQAHHAKESSAIEEDADCVLSLTNKTNFKEWKKGDEYDMAIDVFQRNGYFGLVNLKFNPTTGKFRNVSGEENAPPQKYYDKW